MLTHGTVRIANNTTLLRSTPGSVIFFAVLRRLPPTGGDPPVYPDGCTSRNSGGHLRY